MFLQEIRENILQIPKNDPKSQRVLETGNDDEFSSYEDPELYAFINYSTKHGQAQH